VDLLSVLWIIRINPSAQWSYFSLRNHERG
jgi:hypothetical protein